MSRSRRRTPSSWGQPPPPPPLCNVRGVWALGGLCNGSDAPSLTLNQNKKKLQDGDCMAVAQRCAAVNGLCDICLGMLGTKSGSRPPPPYPPQAGVGRTALPSTIPLQPPHHTKKLCGCAPPCHHSNELHTPSPFDVSKQMDSYVASPGAVPPDSQKAASILQSVKLKTRPDPDTDCTDTGMALGASDTASTMSWASSSDGFSTNVSDTRLLRSFGISICCTVNVM